jgi:hypothetical protein
VAFFNKKKKKSILRGDRRNPCKIFISQYTDVGLVRRETFGFVQERSNKDQMYYVMTGNDGDMMWYSYSDIELIKGHWTNKKKKTEEDEEGEQK